jgi:nitronate monooxygenase
VNPVLRTPLCDLLQIDYPVIQSGMGNVAGPDLVAEVAHAGGLGILAGLGVPPDELRRRIRHVRELTDRPFGVNLWLHTELRPPIDPATIPNHTVDAVQATLNRFRERLGVATTRGRPAQMPDLIDAQFEVILDEHVPVWSIGLGEPGPDMVGRCRERGVKVIAMAARPDDAKVLARSGVDVIVAQGSEAGGHRSTWVKTRTAEVVKLLQKCTTSTTPMYCRPPIQQLARGGSSRFGFSVN